MIQVKMKIRVAALTTITVKTPNHCAPPRHGRHDDPPSGDPFILPRSRRAHAPRHSWRRVSSYLPKNSRSSVRSVVDVRFLGEGCAEAPPAGTDPCAIQIVGKRDP